MGNEECGYTPLYETKQARGRLLYRVFAASVFVAICCIWTYRLCYIPSVDQHGRWVWFGLLAAELWFGLYWVVTQASRWNPIYRVTFKDRLSKRYKNDELLGVDIFVCTANHLVEPPIMVINTVLSVMAYDYPPDKLCVYLSDDGGSKLTFYALVEASKFAQHWIPYCKKFNVEPRSPAAYFGSKECNSGISNEIDEDLVAIEKLYQQMEERIETATELGRVPEEEHSKHKGFSEWDSYSSPRDHDTILQILIDGKVDKCALPSLVYIAREKRPQHPHNFKAGAMNALIRVSSKISNGEIILNVDCDMYSNNSLSVKDALCFFMDEEQSRDFAYVQYPQCFSDITENDLYSSRILVPSNVELHGMDYFGGPLYIGTGCFHRRDALSGRKFTKDCKLERNQREDDRKQQSITELEEAAKPLASCTYEQNTKWGNEMGLIYGSVTEDVVTGLFIQCNGWKSVYFRPERKAFLGAAPTTLLQTLVQHKRWSEGHFQILLSKYSAAWYAHGKISPGLQLCYLCYALWAPNCLATLYYSIFPLLYLLKDMSLYPQLSSLWFLPFAYATSAKYIYSLAEFMYAGGTSLGWWNDQRLWLYRRTTSYLFAFTDTILKLLGFSDSAFIITEKVSEEDVSSRYEKEMMEFGVASPMFTILATLAMLHLFCLVATVKKVMVHEMPMWQYFGTMHLQVVLCGVLVLINRPLYKAMILRKDKGKLPGSLALESTVLALLVCSIFTFLL